MDQPQERTERHPALTTRDLLDLCAAIGYQHRNVLSLLAAPRLGGEVVTYDSDTHTTTTHIHTDMAEDQQEPQPRPLIEKGRVERIQLDPRGMGYIRVADEQEPPC